MNYDLNLVTGDILFSYIKNDIETESIAKLTSGWNNKRINHVAIYVGHGNVIEATSEGVVKTKYTDFLSKSHNVYVGRVSDKMLANKASNYAYTLLGKKYNFAYLDDNTSLYCSQLIAECYKYANNKLDFFPKHKLMFRDTDTNEIIPFFISYYKKLNVKIPENELGTHPATLSLNDKLNIKVIK